VVHAESGLGRPFGSAHSFQGGVYAEEAGVEASGGHYHGVGRDCGA